MSYAELIQQLSAEAARGGMDIDAPVYEEAGRAVTDPTVLGSGSLDAPLGFFGRDPGRDEIHQNEPFIGRGGRLVRDALHRAAFGGPCIDDRAAITIGQGVFWANTVPFKPVDNKAWSVGVKRRFAPLVTTLIAELWRGDTLITLGNDAFLWFGLAEPTLAPSLQAYWAREDRYESHLDVTLRGRALRLYPLPHPSPLNAAWFARFPAMLDARLSALGWPGRPTLPAAPTDSKDNEDESTWTYNRAPEACRSTSADGSATGSNT